MWLVSHFSQSNNFESLFKVHLRLKKTHIINPVIELGRLKTWDMKMRDERMGVENTRKDAMGNREWSSAEIFEIPMALYCYLYNQKAPQGGCGHRRQHARLR